MKLPAYTQTSRMSSELGTLLLAASDNQLVGVWFDDQAHLPDLSACAPDTGQPVLHQAQAQLAAYFAGQRNQFDLPLSLATGTAFQQAVWQALLAIPFGSTCSYGQLASRIGKPSAARAMGAAVGRNPLTIIVPCHRVIGANGSLTGYAGGLSRKTALLQLEGAV
ncbi:methylated-DNA--[protein]-cysteine S-methyltransferase [Rhodoferax antarcticus]|uniref:Methylated-DNA--protein-cysteine methyltransferase n=1 Tax=Rhodoferax antarcticus ANT.BR TaxID=1111071 RepID=A0A1Q8YA12_9BURK|nr:methylated-DNA--[protein]-cysteine S-methyltransferase [Rhodoferax antarcticus]APW46993.1 cysteine methyltransferase [Rhodoferax antarcticus]OLP04848.1 methylated-DNA-cysteine S-methyltransferase family protein [Rhodoferax antarcticus ANT.BR]